ncbi:hypothetical protein BGZ95_005961 [Linnemannia exigua]|uniref:Cytochrome P450 n=1 Tax=Linnemannia exigua TaxID=604196 RepID=A0AAD4H013_9FUNG|nr:hypothetical protein BGZ95_005961 [Linnemannia exigua]
MNKCMTVVSGPMVHEIFMTDDFNFMDALDDMTGARAFFLSMTKSHHEIDSREIHEIVRDMITPNLPKYTARIVDQLEKNLDKEMANCLEQAKTEGRIYERPDDILQRLPDDFERYNMVDLEDICGHLIMLVLIAKGESIPEDLNPSKDRALSAAAIKRMVHKDSFIREVFRYRTEQLTLAHRARQNVTLSNGMVISKGVTAISPDQGEDVEKFHPWRFVGKSKAATKIGSDFLPFGMGKHACPGRFLAIQELKTIGLLMVSRYSKIEIQDPSRTQKILRIRTGASYGTGLLFTSRQ